MTLIDPYRLPAHTRPLRYEVTLEPNLAAARFSGSVTITVETSEDDAELILNAADLEISACQVDEHPVSFALDAATERLILEGSVTAGQHTVEVAFTGVLNDQFRGWYRSTYVADDGTTAVIATSQMQSTDCRRAFPCWDEPDFKAQFSITLIVDPDMMALSNGPELERQPTEDGKVAVRFAETMPMSSYLVAFIVGPLEATDWTESNGTPIRTVHVPGKGHLANFSLDVARFSLNWFENYYGIPYPSDKVDLVGLPDFAAGAMENVGCVTFREQLLLIDPTTATEHELHRVATIVAHELAHMWFGDLVTMNWWNGIWLNEAFATFMEVAATEAFRPSWESWTMFGIDRSAALEVDALSSTRSVEFPVTAPADAEAMFDVLTYQKGGALLRMLEQHLGPDQFRAGVRLYLDRHRYGTTETNDLWAALSEASGQPVGEMMDSWIWQPGVPVIDAHLDGDDLVLTQRRFSYDDSDDTVWQIPVALRVGDEVIRFTLGADPYRRPVGSSPVVVNAHGHGYFRVSYDPGLRSRLSSEVIAELPTLARYVLVDDAWAEVLAGNLEPIDYLGFVERMGHERHHGVWQSIIKGLSAVVRLVADDEDASAVLAARIRSLVVPVLDELGDPCADDTTTTTRLRAMLLSAGAIFGGDTTTIERARQIYARWAEDGSGEPNLVAAATVVVAATGDDADYDAFVERSLTGATPQIRLRHLHALAEFPDRSQMERTIAHAFGDQVKAQDAPYFLRVAIANRHHGALAWQGVQDHWDQAMERFPRPSIDRMIDTIVTLDRPDQVDQAAAFLVEHPVEQAAARIDQILERQRVHAALRARSARSTIDQLRQG